MSRLVWGTIGERFYELGVDLAVLYVANNPGVSWNGLTAVSEAPSGGDPEPYYIDGFKYANLAAAEEFAATLEAFSSPAEFAPCDGVGQIANGLFITQQPRLSFGLCYRTLIGNDLEGADHGYKLHLVYNALASPSARARATISSSPELVKLSWGITAKPPVLSGYRPSSHLVIDSRTTDPTILASLEDLLYGLAFIDPRLPTQQEVITLFGG